MVSKLSIVATSNQRSVQAGAPLSKSEKRTEAQAKFDSLWLAGRFEEDPACSSIERERIERTVDLILRHASLDGAKAVDLGCGSGTLTRMLRDRGCQVDAVDISANALKALQKGKMDNIEAIQELIPETSLQSNSYDLVLAADLIAYLDPKDYRVFFSELARLAASNGYIVCSTPFDIQTEGAAEKFAALAETEVRTLAWIFSYHRFWLKIMWSLEALERFLKTKLAQTAFLQWLVPIHSLASSAKIGFKRNRSILVNLERICRYSSGRKGVSHAIFIGRKRSLFYTETY